MYAYMHVRKYVLLYVRMDILSYASMQRSFQSVPNRQSVDAYRQIVESHSSLGALYVSVLRLKPTVKVPENMFTEERSVVCMYVCTHTSSFILYWCFEKHEWG
jgi:hypothetical protein